MEINHWRHFYVKNQSVKLNIKNIYIYYINSFCVTFSHWYLFHVLRIVFSRAWRVRELTRSCRSKFKMVWHQFSSLVTSLSKKFVQFSSWRAFNFKKFNKFNPKFALFSSAQCSVRSNPKPHLAHCKGFYEGSLSSICKVIDAEKRICSPKVPCGLHESGFKWLMWCRVGVTQIQLKNSF